MEQLEQQNEFIVICVVIGVIFLALMQYGFGKLKKPVLGKEDDSTWIIFIALATVALLIRFPISYTMPGYVSDVGNFRSWADHAYTQGYPGFYSEGYYADYPPLYIYILSFFGLIRDVAGMDIGGQGFGMLIRLPALLTDIILAAVVCNVAKKEMGGKMGLFLSALILFNPAIFINSAVWGQMDIMLAALLILCFWLLYKDRPVWAIAVFMLALLLKPQAMILAPVLLFVFIRNIVVAKDKKKPILELLGAVAAILLVFFLVPLPFGIDKEPLWLISKYTDSVGLYPQATLNAFNLFALLGMNFMNAAETMIGPLSVSAWGIIFICVVCGYTLWLYLKNPSKKFLFAVAAFLVMGVFAFGHGMHERYLYIVPILLLFAFILMRDKRLFTCTILTFGASLLNQAVSLYYYQVYVPQEITVLVSGITLAIIVYTGYVITMLALKPPIEQERAAAAVKTEKKPVQLMMPKHEKPIQKKDALIMLIIAAVYACVAFTNLGSFDVPQTGVEITDGAMVRVEFGQPQDIKSFKYYPGYGEGSFSVLVSDDAEHYMPAVLMKENESVSEVKEEFSDMYKWQEYETAINARYLEIQPLSGDFEMLELALYDSNGNLVEPDSVTSKNGNGNALFDEQDIVPAEATYMTDFYFDEIYHVRTAYENIHGITPYEITHPPLGKIIIALGIQLFGMNAFGWRFMGTLAGVLMLPVIYLLAKLLTKNRKYASFAAILFAVDFMHFAQTRIGTVDSYSILWILCMFTCMYWYAQTNFNVQDVKKTLLPLFLCGLFFGIGAATKWLCIYAGLGLLAVFLVMMYRRYKEYAYACESGEHPDLVRDYHRKLGITLGACVGFFILIPACIYIVSYTPYMLVTDGGAYTGIGDIIDNQKYMLNYHSTLDPEYVHPFSSQWYTWLVDKRPVLFFSEQNSANQTVATLSTMGNPLIWWSGLVAVAWIVVSVLKDPKKRSFGLLFVAIAALSELAPWWFVSREVYIYHYFATVPFLILLIVYWLKFIEQDFKYGKQFGYAFIIACAVFFALFYPVITGIPADAGYVDGLRWLDSWPFY